MTDTERLIEEAERLSDAATPGPWCQNHHGVNNWPGPDAPTRIMELLHNQDDDEEQNYRDAEFIARARTLVPELVTALRAERERAERAAKERDAARAELARLTTPRPIAEAPKDGTWIVGFWDDAPPKVVRRWAEHWRDYMGAPVAWRGLTHFLPLPVLP